MVEKLDLKIIDTEHFVDTANLPVRAEISENCTVQHIQDYLDKNLKVKHLQVVSATVNTTGTVTAPDLKAGTLPPVVYHDVPAFCDIRIKHKTGKHDEDLLVWVPLAWNERMLAVFGQGKRTVAWLSDEWETVFRCMTMRTAVANGFASVTTDAGTRCASTSGFAYNEDTWEYNADLYHNWLDYSLHVASMVGKAVTEALSGMAPRYSYAYGGSGGGREALMQCQKYPLDYDGIYCDCPGVYLHRACMSMAWPTAVMNTYHNPLAPAKQEAFRTALWEQVGGCEAFYKLMEKQWLDPMTLVGTETADGVITETDAIVMQKIFEGPQTEDGQFLYWGLYPGTDMWNLGLNPGTARVVKVDGKYEPARHMIAYEHIAHWLECDPDWDEKRLTIKEFTRLFYKGLEKFPEMDSANPDLRNLRDCGHKLIIVHGLSDQTLPPEAIIHYYEKVAEVVGSMEETKEFARLFMIPGDSHGSNTYFGHGPTKATGMTALIRWVEDGIAPETMPGCRMDIQTHEILEEGETPVYF